ncbi:MAG: hypothetical protein WCH11_03420 [Bdellovibrio sp.]
MMGTTQARKLNLVVHALIATAVGVQVSLALAQAQPNQTAESSRAQNQLSRAAQTALDPTIQINQEQVSSVFQDIVVVQRKAKDKARKFLLSTFGSFDFSDGPVTMYGLNTNIGYAFSDFWELYINFVPVFMAQGRPIVKKVETFLLDPSQCAGQAGCSGRLTYAVPKTQMGLELLWIPAYGKDSWGAYSIVRSDTFFKFGVHQITYSPNIGITGGTGNRFQLMLGKTYFIRQTFNLRFAAGMHSIETLVSSDPAGTLIEKRSSTVAVLESGLVFYF